MSLVHFLCTFSIWTASTNRTFLFFHKLFWIFIPHPLPESRNICANEERTWRPSAIGHRGLFCSKPISWEAVFLVQLNLFPSALVSACYAFSESRSVRGGVLGTTFSTATVGYENRSLQSDPLLANGYDLLLAHSSEPGSPRSLRLDFFLLVFQFYSHLCRLTSISAHLPIFSSVCVGKGESACAHAISLSLCVRVVWFRGFSSQKSRNNLKRRRIEWGWCYQLYFHSIERSLP